MKCIPVTMKDGSTVMATVDDSVTELDQCDIEQLQAWVDHVKARRAKKKVSDLLTERPDTNKRQEEAQNNA